MIALLTILVAIPLGYFCTRRSTAYLIYIAAFAQVYTFQTASLLMEWVNGSAAAFPQTKSQNVLGGSSGYLVFTSLVYAIGIGLVWVGSWLRARRSARSVVTVDLARAA